MHAKEKCLAPLLLVKPGRFDTFVLIEKMRLFYISLCIPLLARRLQRTFDEKENFPIMKNEEKSTVKNVFEVFAEAEEFPA